MSSELPPKRRTSQSSTIIVAAIVMLLAASGLVAVKVLRSGDEHAPAVAAAPSPEEDSRRNAPAPPPPPPPVEEPAPSASAAVASIAKVGKAPAACGGPCNGETTSELNQFLAGRAAAGRKCYEKALMQNGSLAGRIRVALRISASGQPCSASLEVDELHDTGLAACLSGMFRASTYPLPKGGCLDVRVPMAFSSQR